MRKGGAEEEILSLLRTSGEKYLSGEALSKKFKVSRTAIWKHIHSLMDQGYEFESHTNLGYRLQSVPDLLLPAEIENALGTKYVGRELYCFNEIGSHHQRPTCPLVPAQDIAGEIQGQRQQQQAQPKQVVEAARAFISAGHCDAQ